MEFSEQKYLNLQELVQQQVRLLLILIMQQFHLGQIRIIQLRLIMRLRRMGKLQDILFRQLSLIMDDSMHQRSIKLPLMLMEELLQRQLCRDMELLLLLLQILQEVVIDLLDGVQLFQRLCLLEILLSLLNGHMLVEEEVEEDEVEDQALHQVHHLLQVAQARLQHQVLEIE